MKTYKDWEESNVDLDKYLGQEPCEIDEELYNYIAEVVSPNYLGWENGLVQGGDPNKSDEDLEGEDIYYYNTVRNIGSKSFYLGILPEFKQ